MTYVPHPDGLVLFEAFPSKVPGVYGPTASGIIKMERSNDFEGVGELPHWAQWLCQRLLWCGQRECAEHCLVRLDWDRDCNVIDIIVVYVVALEGSAIS